MVRGRGGNKEILSSSEKGALLSERQDLMELKREKEQGGTGTSAERLDMANVDRQIARIDRAIADRQIPKLKGIEKDKLIKEEEELIRNLQENLPTRDEMDHPTKNPGAVRKHMRWLDRNKSNIERWRYIQRVVHEDDPRSIENLRREK